MILAFDIGDTKLTTALVDEQCGGIVDYQNHLVLPGEKGSDSIDHLISAGNLLIKNNPKNIVERIGISFGGPIDHDRKSVIKSQHVNGWEGLPLVSIMEQKFNLPTVLENDANAAVTGEWRFGVGRNLDSCIYVQLSTGIGCGLILDGKLYRGKGMAGEIGHLMVKKKGKKCVCGNKGCLECYASGWALARIASKIFRYPSNAHELFLAYSKSDPNAQLTVRKAMDALATALNHLICLFDPEVIILGGGITKSRDVISMELFPLLKKMTPPFLKNRTKYAFASLAGRETLLGVAFLASMFT